MEEFWYQLTEYIPKRRLKSFIEPFKRYGEKKEMKIKGTENCAAIFTTGRFRSEGE